jgi:hypothetical protein
MIATKTLTAAGSRQSQPDSSRDLAIHETAAAMTQVPARH